MKHLLVISLLILVSACSSKQPSEIAQSSGDIPIWSLTETVSIQESNDLIFGYAIGPAVTSDDEILIVDIQKYVVHHFSPDGTHLGTFSQSGSGPGEMKNFSGSIITSNDEFVVFDRSEMRFTFFESLDGTWTHTKMINSETVPSVFFEGTDQTIIGRTTISFNRSNLNKPDPGYYVRQMTYEGEILKDSLLYGPMNNFLVWETNNGFTIRSFPGEYGETAFTSVYDKNTIIHATSEIFEFTIMDVNTGETRTFFHDIPRIPLTSAEKDTLISQAGDRFASAMREKMPSHKRAINSFFVDDEGRIWVNVPTPAEDDPAYNYLILDLQGEFLGKVSTPNGRSISTVANNKVYVTKRDPESGTSIHVYTITKN